MAILDKDVSLEETKDWRKLSKLLEEHIPNWEPGSAFGYHSFTIGWLVDQLVRRVDAKHRSIGQFIRDELCQAFCKLGNF